MNDNDNESQRLAAQISELKKSYAAGKRNFSEINLVQANLVAITLDKAELTRANLEGVNLRLASLQGVYLTRVNLSYSNLAKANLSDANLIGANLSNADLSDANCAGAFLNEANLYGANLSRVNLTGASLYKVNLTQTNLRGAYYDEKTCFDQGFDPIAAQMVKSQAIDLEPFLEEMLEEGLTKLEELEVSGTQPLVGGTSLARPVAVESSPIQSVKTNSFVSQSESLNQSDLEMAQQIRQLLLELSQANSISTYTQKMKVVIKAAQHLKSDPTWKAKISNLQSGEKREAFKQAIDHPLAPPLLLSLDFES